MIQRLPTDPLQPSNGRNSEFKYSESTEVRGDLLTGPLISEKESNEEADTYYNEDQDVKEASFGVEGEGI